MLALARFFFCFFRRGRERARRERMQNLAGEDASAGTPIPQALLDRPGEPVGLVGLPEFQIFKIRHMYLIGNIYIYIFGDHTKICCQAHLNLNPKKGAPHGLVATNYNFA